MSKRAVITNINRLSSHDGPGMRITIFFKGCSLKCRWCHNPETISLSREMSWDRKACIGCGHCVSSCEKSAVKFVSGKYPFDKIVCDKCLKCVDVCPAKAFSIEGKEYCTDEVARIIDKDIELIKSLGGGVTFSGGEPALQYEFIDELLEKLKLANIHTALDTCGAASSEAYRKLIPKIDLILFDIKEANTEKHKEFTGSDNKIILENFQIISDLLRGMVDSSKIWIRTPIVPNMSMNENNIIEIGEFLSGYTDVVDRWELCAFNKLCDEKYLALGKKWELCDTPLVTDAQARNLLNLAKKSAVAINKITISGLTKN